MNDDERKLMSFHDGELDREANAEVRERLERDPPARAELARLGVVGELVRGVHEQRVGSVDLTDAIVRRALAVAPSPGITRAKRTRRERFAPAGAVLALAAMVCLFVVSYRETTGPETVHLAATPGPSLGADPVPAPLEKAAAGPAGGGVSIQTVDFGATQGAIFVVSAGESETMVVWTLEDANDKG